MTNKKLEAKIDRLDAQLIEKYRNDTELFARLDRAQRELGLLCGERPFAPFLRPHFFTREKYERISRAAEVLAGAFEKLTEAALEDNGIMRELDLSEREERMARIDPGYKTICNSSRLDAFFDGDDFKFLEYNGETPAGIIDQMQIEKVLALIPETEEFLGKNEHWRPQPHKALLAALVTDYREFGGQKEKPNIAIVDWKDVSTFSEFEILLDYFTAEGYPTKIVDPRELEYDGKTLRHEDFAVDIFYKRVLIHEFQEVFPADNPLANAYRDGNIFMANSFRTKIPHKKAGFAILSDEKYARLFDDAQLETIKNHIPWTRRVREMKTKFHDAEIDLTEYLLKNRDQFLLKPNDDYGGSGIVFGWESDENQWSVALRHALENSFVVQERAAVEKIKISTYHETAEIEELLIDFDPFLFRGKVEGGLVRLSAKSLVNVAAGGGETALIVVEDEDYS